MPKQLTIRGMSDDLGRQLTRLSCERGQSVNTLALSILEAAVGIEARRARLKRCSTWSPADVSGVDRALADQRVVDDEAWR
jgi:plasmid stability protein